MRDILRKILEENDFLTKNEPFGIEEALQADRTDSFGFDFLTVLFLDEEKFSKGILNEYIERLFKEFSQQDDLKMGWDKNLSLLIMLKVDSIDISTKIQSLIFDIEEDPFMFKKYILSYTDKQEDIFTEQLGYYDENEVLKFLNHILYDSEKFSIFKSKKDCEEYLLYDIVSKLFIKLPYLNIINQDKEIHTLMTEIDESFTEEEREILNKLLELKDNGGDDPAIQKVLEVIGVTENE
ncbi:ABC-three component system middle component 1 [Exiguobacterium sp. E4787]|uniref:ABC-three component system middle component 1 n=1 Tax=Exiguobacterium sp. E4787 TaxID=2751225 RepID=UPI001BE6EC15|nr:ABC-three component system middle component 1 [Exiguobacterium sp. E4787]